MQVLGFVDTRDFAVHPTSENLGVVCRWEVRPLLPHRKKARAMLPDCSMEREWKVSAGAVIHRWAGNGLSWSLADRQLPANEMAKLWWEIARAEQRMACT